MGIRIYYGYWILILGSLINALGMGVLYYGVSIFFLPLKRDLEVSSAAISLLYATARLEGGIEGPLVGYLVDRFGPRLMIIAGSVLTGVGLLLLSTTHSFLAFFLIYICIVALGNNAGCYHPVSAAVNNWFIRRRGMGFAVISAAMNTGGMIVAPVLSYLILHYGWRTGAVVSGLAILGVCIPAALPIIRSPEDKGLCPDGDPPPGKDGGEALRPQTETAEVHYTPREALGALNFWILAFAISVRIMVTVALTIHLVPIVVWKGWDETTGAYVVSFYAFGTILITLVLGWLGDRWSKPLLSAAALLPTIIGILGFTFSSSVVFLLLFPLGLALAMGTVPLNWALVGDLFGRRRFATIRGFISVSIGVATFVSPIYAGWIFDRTQSYTTVLLTFVAALLVAGFLFVLLHQRSHLPAGRDRPTG